MMQSCPTCHNEVEVMTSHNATREHIIANGGFDFFHLRPDPLPDRYTLPVEHH